VRITNNMISQGVLDNLQRNFGFVSTLEEVLSSGRQFRFPEDNPIAYVESLNLRQELNENRRFVRNINIGETNLQLSETTLGLVNDRLQRVRTLALQAANSSLSTEAIEGISLEINQAFQDIVQLANSNFEGRYIFGGDKTLRTPFEFIGDSEVAEGVVYRGDFGPRLSEISQNEFLAMNLTGIESFFTSLNEITSSVAVTPDVLLAPQLAGVDPPLAAAAGTFTVDGVSIAFDPATDTLASLRDAINRSVTTADARVTSDGRLVIRSLTSNDVELANGTSNILETLDMFHRIEGGAIGAGITPATTLAALGITGDALSISVGEDVYQIDLAGAVDVQGVIDAVAASGAPIEVFVNGAGTGLTFSATESVDSLEITSLRKIFGSTAFAPGAIGLGTTLASLGITTGTLDISNDGVVTSIDLSGAATVGDVIEAINTQVNGVTATINADGTSIDLESASFTASLSAADAGGANIAAVLGFAQTRSSDNAADFDVATPGEVDEVASENVFLTLMRLRTALESGTVNSETLSSIITEIDRDLGRVLTNRSTVGARINRLESTRDRFDAFSIYLTQLLSENEDADLAETATALATQQAVLEAALNAGARMLQPSLLDFLT